METPSGTRKTRRGTGLVNDLLRESEREVATSTASTECLVNSSRHQFIMCAISFYLTIYVLVGQL